jgi:hypothetical protein
MNLEIRVCLDLGSEGSGFECGQEQLKQCCQLCGVQNATVSGFCLLTVSGRLEGPRAMRGQRSEEATLPVAEIMLLLL